MLIPHVVSTEADKVFVNILNNQSVALADGDAVAWNTATPDGVRTTQPTSTTLSLFVGLADGAIAASAYGLAQAYGYKSVALITNTTNTAVATGDVLIAVAAADYLNRSSAGSVGISGFVFCAATVATATTPAPVSSSGVFIRAL